MKKLVSGGRMKEIDRRTIQEIGIPSMVLMERAALAIADQVMDLTGKTANIWAACGTGNNGADGIAAARILHCRGYHVTIILIGDREHGTREYETQLEIAENLGIPAIEFRDFLPGKCHLLIDAIFGIGLSREIDGEYREAMEFLQEQKSRAVVAADIPSGIHSDTGKVMGIALVADVTVTFGWTKTGMMVYPGKSYCGRLVVSDIGFPEEAIEHAGFDAFCYDIEDLELIPERRQDSNKGTYGKVLIVAGSRNMSGAAYLSALAAYRTGAGLVRILTVEENRQILQTQLPEAVLTTYDPDMSSKDREGFMALIEEVCDWATVIAAGPGLGQGEYVKDLLEMVLTNAYAPIILDADALNQVARYPYLSGYFTENIIVTPHLGELSRLTGQRIEELKDDLIGIAKEYSGQYGVTCVCKDAATVVCTRDGEVYINQSGNSGMAKAGSGDVLTGAIAGLLAIGMEINQAVPMGVYLHGLAGDEAGRRRGKAGMLAGDIADCLGEFGGIRS